MGFVLIGTLLALLKYFAVAPVAQLSWWWVWSPFLLAALWWSFADSAGLTAKRQMDRLDDRREKRRRQTIEAMGMDYQMLKKAGTATRYNDARTAKASKRETLRDEKRRRNEETLARSSTQFGSEFSATGVNDLPPSPQPPPADERR